MSDLTQLFSQLAWKNVVPREILNRKWVHIIVKLAVKHGNWKKLASRSLWKMAEPNTWHASRATFNSNLSHDVVQRLLVFQAPRWGGGVGCSHRETVFERSHAFDASARVNCHDLLQTVPVLFGRTWRRCFAGSGVRSKALDTNVPCPLLIVVVALQGVWMVRSNQWAVWNWSFTSLCHPVWVLTI